ncbi:helix-turn-helix transcriptional regulator [Streptococcus sp. S784/96/1]|uniref:helix-turn-helix transcriptional regulator n=1 Tax=Streptococcus sp. S784/96/1 TaxID=2653499 RepID=UPI0013894EEB|nr:AraC family transcriptional regulator [Streptococcus sp. S784/96/1]
MLSKNLLNKLPSFGNTLEAITKSELYTYHEDDFMPFSKINERANKITMAEILDGINLDANQHIGMVYNKLDFPTRLHYHDYVELSFLVSGRLVHIINKQPFVLTPGQMAIIPEETRHLLAPIEEEKPEIIDILIHSNLAKLILDYNPNQHLLTEIRILNLTSSQLKQLETFLSAFISHLHKTDLAIIGQFLQVIHSFSLQKSFVLKKKLSSLTEKCLKLIQENPQLISQKNLAKQLNYSASYLSRTIKNETGKTIAEHIVDSKLALSQDYLANTTIPINDIATLIGYESSSHFYQRFKEKYLITPKHYRNLMQQDV